MVILIAGFFVYSLAGDRSTSSAGEAIMVAGALAGGWLLVKRFIFRSYEP
ncbi:MAG TPA: hypothetical protein VG742_06295 [Dongiaceae bacterium]|nr:hypothetical protein [Dongiaceae bacterium]